MKLNLIGPHQIIYKGEIISLIVPTEEGEITILPNHIPLISSLIKGRVKIKDISQQEYLFEIDGGLLEVNPLEINLLVIPY